MPNMANITVKKFDGTTDVVYDALVGASGDSSPAMWRQDTGAAVTLPIGLRSTMRIQTQFNGPKSARQLRYNFAMPYAYQDTTTGLYAAKDSLVLTGVMTLPQAIPNGYLQEGCQGFNLLASALIRSVIATGYAPT